MRALGAVAIIDPEMDELDVFLGEIATLLSDPRDDLMRLEHTLTDGYAKALSIEAERLRLAKRLGEVARNIGRGDTASTTEELSSLSRRLEGTGGELDRLRGVLGDLRRHADAVRTAAVR